jgi:hypothetical protein
MGALIFYVSSKIPMVAGGYDGAFLYNIVCSATYIKKGGLIL